MSAVSREQSASGSVLAAMLDKIRKLSRRELGQLAQSAIDQMDSLDPDPDIEGQWDEDGINSVFLGDSLKRQGPGCMISDEDHSVDDKPCDEHAEDGV